MEIDTNCFLKFFKKGGGSKEPGHEPILLRFSPPARHSTLFLRLTRGLCVINRCVILVPRE